MDVLPADNNRLSGMLGVLLWPAVGIAILAVCLWAMRRRRARPGQDTTLDIGFTLHDVNRMYQAGQISKQEFKSLKASVVGVTETATVSDADRE